MSAAGPTAHDRFARALRLSIDHLLDGGRTMRYDWKDLAKTEKTHAGSLVEIYIQRQFGFGDSKAQLDYRIAGVDVDCKFSQKMNGWMIPPEAVNRLCLLVWADDRVGEWSVGLIRARRSWLNKGKNRDSKKTLSKLGVTNIDWLFKRAKLPPNLYHSLPPGDVSYILDGSVDGRERVRRLFEKVQGKVVPRVAIETAATQYDPMKRVRGNGGARTALRPSGVVILGHTHARCAVALGLQPPPKGDFIAVRLVPVRSGCGRAMAKIGKRSWAIAGPADPIVKAPLL